MDVGGDAPPGSSADAGDEHRSGFVAVVGRPNVGKSTLVNRILGQKVTITSSRPNTTRRSVRGVLHGAGSQAVFVDTPGLHRPKTELGRRLNERVGDALEDVDVVLAVLDATEPVGPGDRMVLSRAVAGRASARDQVPGGDDGPRAGPAGPPPVLVAVNKVDRASPAQVLERLAEASDVVGSAGADAEYFPVSATTGEGVGALVAAVLDLLPPGPRYFPVGMVSDMPEHFWVAELVREQLLARVHEELPHAIACRVTEWEWPRIRVDIVVERESQKGIVIGRAGAVLKDVGTAVRAQLPPGAFLELHVRVDKHWQQRSDVIERLGY
ncbi:MAG TPA: GTPase Era [Acidimicrobiaceae bacterium]|nr:GTPase Era [Acidimicrobiaceae bacterium]